MISEIKKFSATIQYPSLYRMELFNANINCMNMEVKIISYFEINFEIHFGIYFSTLEINLEVKWHLKFTYFF